MQRPPRRVFTPGALVLYLVLLSLGVAGFAFGQKYYSNWFKEWRRSRPRYAAERAMEALAANQPEAVRKEVAILMGERPIYVRGFFNQQFSELFEGPVLRNRVMTYTDLTTRLMARQYWREAADVAWKALYEYHIVGRTIEWLPPWECLFYINQKLEAEAKAAIEPRATVPQIAFILGAHGVDRARTPAQMEPLPYLGRPDLTTNLSAGYLASTPPPGGGPTPTAPILSALKQGYEADTTPALMLAASALRQEAARLNIPVQRRQFEAKAQEWFAAAEQHLTAMEMLGLRSGRNPRQMEVFWKTNMRMGPSYLDRDPTALEFYWNARSTDTQVVPVAFLNSMQRDPRMTLLDFANADQVENGFFGASKPYFRNGDGSLEIYTNCAVRLSFTSPAPVRRLTLAYASRVVLGLPPILLVRFGENQVYPLLLDAAMTVGKKTPREPNGKLPFVPGLISLDCNLPAGQHDLEFWFLNDAMLDWPSRKVLEDRNVLLQRLALIHVPPQ